VGGPAQLAGVATGPGWPARVGSVTGLVVWAGVLTRVVLDASDDALIPWYLGGLVLFLVVQVVVLSRRALPVAVLYLAFAFEAALMLVLLSLDSEQDILSGLLALECYQAAVSLDGRPRVMWVAVLVALIPVSLVVATGWLDGLSVSFVPMAASIVLSMFVVVGRDLEVAGAESRAMVAELREAQRGLEVYAGQVEELAVIEERSRVALDLEASVSATLADVLSTTQAVRDQRDAPAEAGALLERLQALTQQALAQMRRVIAELRPPSASPAETASSAPTDRT
jgi:signal transduction histidine kinase